MVHCIYQGVTGLNFQIKMYLSPLNDVFILTNSANPDEMLHFLTFHLGLHCLLKYQFMGFQYTKG